MEKKKRLGLRFLGPRFLNFGGLGLFGAPALAHYLHGPRAETGNKKFGIK
jgi:hypothetical protein